MIDDLVPALRDVTGTRWTVTLENAAGTPTLVEAARATEEAAREAILATPLVRAALEAFPDAVLEGWTPPQRSIA